MSEKNAIVKIRMIMDGRKLLTGGTLAVSVASLAVGSVALATQPTIPEIQKVEEVHMMIPNLEEKPSINSEEIQTLIREGTEKTKREIDEDRKKDLSAFREEINKAKFEASLASVNVETMIRDANENSQTFSKNFSEVKGELEKYQNTFAEKWAELELWKKAMEKKVGDFEEKYQEIKKLYGELKEIKGVSDIGTATKYFQDNLKEYIDEKNRMEDLLKRFKDEMIDRLL